MRRILRFSVLPVMLLAPLAAGQQAVEPEAAPPPPQPGPGWSIDLTAGLWLPRLGGTSKLGPSSVGAISLETQLDLDGGESVFNAELTVSHGSNWYARFSGFEFSTDCRGTFVGNGVFGDLSLMEGDPYRASMDLFSVGGEVGLNLLPKLGIDSDFARLRFVPEIGVRYVEVEQVVELGSGDRQAPDGEWIGLYGGLSMHLRYAPADGLIVGRSLRLEGGGAIGPAFGGDGGFLWTVRAGLTLEVFQNIGLMFGYRLLELDVEDGDWEFDGGLQGLYLGGTISF